MRRWNGSPLVQIMACRLDGAEPLSEPMLTYCQLEPKDHVSMKMYFKIQIFSFKKMRLNMLSAKWRPFHYCDVKMGAMASQITSLTTVYSTVHSDAYHRKHQGSASLAFVLGIHRWPVNSPHKWPVTRKMFPFDDVIMLFRGRWVDIMSLHKCLPHCWPLLRGIRRSPIFPQRTSDAEFGCLFCF